MLTGVIIANKLGMVKIIAFDLEPATINLLKQGVVSAAIVQRPYYMGYLSVYILDSIVTLGPAKTMKLLSPYLSGSKNCTNYFSITLTILHSNN